MGEDPIKPGSRQEAAGMMGKGTQTCRLPDHSDDYYCSICAAELWLDGAKAAKTGADSAAAASVWLIGQVVWASDC